MFIVPKEVATSDSQQQLQHCFPFTLRDGDQVTVSYRDCFENQQRIEQRRSVTKQFNLNDEEQLILFAVEAESIAPCFAKLLRGVVQKVDRKAERVLIKECGSPVNEDGKIYLEADDAERSAVSIGHLKVDDRLDISAVTNVYKIKYPLRPYMFWRRRFVVGSAYAEQVARVTLRTHDPAILGNRVAKGSVTTHVVTVKPSALQADHEVLQIEGYRILSINVVRNDNERDLDGDQEEESCRLKDFDSFTQLSNLDRSCLAASTRWVESDDPVKSVSHFVPAKQQQRLELQDDELNDGTSRNWNCYVKTNETAKIQLNFTAGRTGLFRAYFAVLTHDSELLVPIHFDVYENENQLPRLLRGTGCFTSQSTGSRQLTLEEKYNLFVLRQRLRYGKSKIGYINRNGERMYVACYVLDFSLNTLLEAKDWLLHAIGNRNKSSSTFYNSLLAEQYITAVTDQESIGEQNFHVAYKHQIKYNALQQSFKAMDASLHNPAMRLATARDQTLLCIEMSCNRFNCAQHISDKCYAVFYYLDKNEKLLEATTCFDSIKGLPQGFCLTKRGMQTRSTMFSMLALPIDSIENGEISCILPKAVRLPFLVGEKLATPLNCTVLVSFESPMIDMRRCYEAIEIISNADQTRAALAQLLFPLETRNATKSTATQSFGHHAALRALDNRRRLRLEAIPTYDSRALFRDTAQQVCLSDDFLKPARVNASIRLDAVQQLVIKSFSAALQAGKQSTTPYLLIGPPGTGKTSVLIKIILQAFTVADTRCLVVAPSNTAADMLYTLLTTGRQEAAASSSSAKCHLLSPKVDIVRLYSSEHSESSLVPANVKRDGICLEDDVDGGSKKGATSRRERYKKLVNEALKGRVCVCTPLMSVHLRRGIEWNNNRVSEALASDQAPPSNFAYTHLFVDEAGKCSEADFIVPLLALDFSALSPKKAEKLHGRNTGRCPAILLAGDPFQLGPHVDSVCQGGSRQNRDELSTAFYTFLRRSSGGAKANNNIDQKLPKLLSKWNICSISPLERLFVQYEFAQQHGSVIPNMTMLRANYRSPPKISDFTSNHFYHGQIHSAAPAHGPLSTLLVHHDRRKLQESRDEGASVYSVDEARMVADLAIAFVDCASLGQKPDLAVLTPYRHQVKAIRLAMLGAFARWLERRRHPQIPANADPALWSSQIDACLPMVYTIDEFQGREAGTIILSLARSQSTVPPTEDDLLYKCFADDVLLSTGDINANSTPAEKYAAVMRCTTSEARVAARTRFVNKNLGFVADDRRINEAVTRTRGRLIVVCNKSLLEMCPTWDNFAAYCVDKSYDISDDDERKCLIRDIAKLASQAAKEINSN